MIGQRVESRPDLSWDALLLVVAGLGLGGGALALGATPLAIAALLPLALGGSSWLLNRERPFAATFTEAALEIEDPPATVPYAGVQSVWAAGYPVDPTGFRKRSCPIQVQHEGGLLRIPRRLNVPSHEVYRFLVGQVPARGGRDVNPALAEYLERQESYYGPENVWTYRAAGRRARPSGYRGLRAFGLGLIVAGAAWIAVGFSGLGDEGWGWGGILCAVLGALFFAASFAQGAQAGRMIKGWKRASLVIGPQGMAMVQGDIQGDVRWPELLEVRYRPQPASFHLTYAGGMVGILLRVKGADILIADVYDRPLYVIYDRIMAASGRSAPADHAL